MVLVRFSDLSEPWLLIEQVTTHSYTINYGKDYIYLHNALAKSLTCRGSTGNIDSIIIVGFLESIIKKKFKGSGRLGKQIKIVLKNKRSDIQGEVKKLHRYKISSYRRPWPLIHTFKLLLRPTPALSQDNDVPDDDSEPLQNRWNFHCMCSKGRQIKHIIDWKDFYQK